MLRGVSIPLGTLTCTRRRARRAPARCDEGALEASPLAAGNCNERDAGFDVPNVRKLRIGKPDARVTTVGGMVSVAGAQRVFDLEMLAADPLFVHLAGGSVPSIDVLYGDLRRFDAQALEDLEELLAEQGVAPLRELRFAEVFMDADTTVAPLFGQQEGARPGPTRATTGDRISPDPGARRADRHHRRRTPAAGRHRPGRGGRRGHRDGSDRRARSKLSGIPCLA